MEVLNFLAMVYGYGGMAIMLLLLLYGIFGLLVRSCIDDNISYMCLVEAIKRHEDKHHTPKKRRK